MTTMRTEWLEILDRIPGKGLKGNGFPRNVLGVIMRNPDTFGSFLEYWVSSKLQMTLSMREQELVILRMACLYGSNYVWKHHVPVGTEFGVTSEELHALHDGHFKVFFTQRERSLLVLTDELVETHAISEATWESYGKLFLEKELVDLISLISQYVFFSLINNAMQVQVEPELENIEGL